MQDENAKKYQALERSQNPRAFQHKYILHNTLDIQEATGDKDSDATHLHRYNRAQDQSDEART